MKKTLVDLLRLFILVNLIVLAFYLLPTAAPARQESNVTTSHNDARPLFAGYLDVNQCQKPSDELRFRPTYQKTAYHSPR